MPYNQQQCSQPSTPSLSLRIWTPHCNRRLHPCTSPEHVYTCDALARRLECRHLCHWSHKSMGSRQRAMPCRAGGGYLLSLPIVGSRSNDGHDSSCVRKSCLRILDITHV